MSEEGATSRLPLLAQTQRGDEYVSYTDFDENGEDFSLTSAALAAGYLYQFNPDWQLIGAVLPYYHHSSLGERGKDYWQVMGGAVARYTRNDRLWWLLLTTRTWHHVMTWARHHFERDAPRESLLP